LVPLVQPNVLVACHEGTDVLPYGRGGICYREFYVYQVFVKHSVLAAIYETQRFITCLQELAGAVCPSQMPGLHLHTMFSDLRFQALMERSINMVVLWGVAPCSLVDIDLS
jgi:hypothetical protein